MYDSFIYFLGMILFIYIQSSHVNQCSSIATAKVPTVRFFFMKHELKGVLKY
jgi:hypothetical protein